MEFGQAMTEVYRDNKIFDGEVIGYRYSKVHIMAGHANEDQGDYLDALCGKGFINEDNTHFTDLDRADGTKEICKKCLKKLH